MSLINFNITLGSHPKERQPGEELKSLKQRLRCKMTWIIHTVLWFGFMGCIYAMCNDDNNILLGESIMSNLRDIIHNDHPCTVYMMQNRTFLDNVLRGNDLNEIARNMNQIDLITIYRMKYRYALELNDHEDITRASNMILQRAIRNENHVRDLSFEYKRKLIGSVTADYSGVGINVVGTNLEYTSHEAKLMTLKQVENMIEVIDNANEAIYNIMPLIYQLSEDRANAQDMLNTHILSRATRWPFMIHFLYYDVYTEIIILEKMFDMSMYSISMFNPIATMHNTNHFVYFMGCMLTGYGIHFFPLLFFAVVIYHFSPNAWLVHLLLRKFFQEEEDVSLSSQIDVATARLQTAEHFERHKYSFMIKNGIEIISRAIKNVLIFFVTCNMVSVAICCIVAGVKQSGTVYGESDTSVRLVRTISEDYMSKIENRSRIIDSIWEDFSKHDTCLYTMCGIVAGLLSHLLVNIVVKACLRCAFSSMKREGNVIEYINDKGKICTETFLRKIFTKWFFQGTIISHVISSIIMGAFNSRVLFPESNGWMSVNSQTMDKFVPWSSILHHQDTL